LAFGDVVKIHTLQTLALDGDECNRTLQFSYAPETASVYPSCKELSEIQGHFGRSDEIIQD